MGGNNRQRKYSISNLLFVFNMFNSNKKSKGGIRKCDHGMENGVSKVWHISDSDAIWYDKLVVQIGRVY
jgi:hypothetical protein